MMAVLSPRLRISRAASPPVISGRRQSMKQTRNSSPSSMDCRARSTASLPESVHSARIPVLMSILVTLSQVSKSSSATSAFHPASSAIRSSRRSSVWSRSATRMMNSAPLSGSVRISMVPPIISTIFLVIAIPSPVPCILLTVEVLSRSKGSKILCANSGLIPIPLSLTRISYIALPLCELGNCLSCTDTVPPAGVNLMALDMRFSST